MVSLLNPGLPPLSLQDVLDNASRLVDKHLQDDNSYLDLVDLLNIPGERQASLSGLQDQDYPSLPAGLGLEGLDSLSEISLEKRVPLPPELVEQFGRMQCNCMMGLFPEIERAWLTIDSDIFVWKYEDGSDVAIFDGLSETILSVALVKPKPGIFQPHIQYLMCLATPVDIILLGVSFFKTSEGGVGDYVGEEMHLLPDPLFSAPSDGEFITAITATDTGRIFMAGRDGCLYELTYQAENGWFSRKCRKINHSTSSLSFLIPSFLNFSFSEDDPLVQISIDNSRGILYGRTKKGSIQVFDLGKDKEGMGRIASQTQTSIINTAANVARNIEKSHFKSIIHIAAITESESMSIHLVAVTESGVRLYFSTTPLPPRGARPSRLSLVHVRLPPGFSATSTPQPGTVHTAHHSRGCLLLVSSQNKDTDILWTISPDSFPFQKQLMEAYTTVGLAGRTWAVGEAVSPADVPPLTPPPTPGIEPPRPLAPPAVVTQHSRPPRRFLVLSAQGIHILQKLRPVEQLRQLMVEGGGPDAQQVKAFFRLHPVAQACAACLVLATSRAQHDQEVADWARMAFFMYGGEVQYSAAHRGLHSSFNPGMSTTIMYSPGSMGSSVMPGSPVHNGPPLHMSTPAPGALPPTMAPSPQEVVYSGKHNAIYMYLARLLRPLWGAPVATEITAKGAQGPTTYLTSSLSPQELTLTLEMTRDLADFVDFNAKFDVDSQPDLAPPMDEPGRKRLAVEMQRLEKLSLQHVQELLHRVEETLGLWRILTDHQLHTLAQGLDLNQQNQLKSMTLKTLVTSGKEMCSALVSCLVGRYLEDSSTVDSISGTLRQVCPSLYSGDDATCSKANELLQAAKVNTNVMERDTQLQEALRLLKTVHQPLHLSAITPQLAQVHFYLGILELGLAEARKVDPQMLAVHFYNNGEPQEDIQGMGAYLARQQCYKAVTDCVCQLWAASVSHPTNPSVPSSPGPPPTPDTRTLDPQTALAYKEELLAAALRSDDPLFHAALYDWLFATNHAEKLLEVTTPHVEQYLRRQVNLHTEATGALDLLWRHYQRTDNFPAATRILAQLAEAEGTGVTLSQRLEYLSRAVICAKSSTSRPGGQTQGDLLHDLEEKMEVARLQVCVHKALGGLPSSPDTLAARGALDTRLVDITSLYEDYADRYELHEVKLAIVHCAGLYDAALIENLWQSIIDKEMASSATLPPSDRIASLTHRLAAIARLYVNAERYFPVASVLRCLVRGCGAGGLEVAWLAPLLLDDVGVAPARLLELVDRLWKAKDPVWAALGRPYLPLEALQGLVSHIAGGPHKMPQGDRRRLVTQALDTVSMYLVELQAISATDPTVLQLTQGLRASQAQLDRL